MTRSWLTFTTTSLTFVLALATTAVQAQNAPEPERAPTTPEKRAPLTASGRLAAAKTAFIKRGDGSDIPYRVVSSTMEGWGHFALVDSAAQADIVMEVSAPNTDRGVSVTSSSKPSETTGRMEQSTNTTKELSGGPVKIQVYDARTHMLLWSGTEQPKFAFKQKAREDNLVDAAQRLVTKFRERVEPAPTK